MQTMASGAMRAGGLEQLEPVHARHADVGEDDVDVFAADQVARGESIVGNRHLEPIALEQDAHPLAHRLLIVDNQDAQRFVHGPWPGGAVRATLTMPACCERHRTAG